MIEYLSYILFFGLLIVLIIYGYIRIKYGFWILQPVFHIYDISYMISPPGVINHSLPNKNKYTNFKNIKTILYNTLTEIELNRIVNFIKLNYLQNKDNIFSPKLINISPYFNGHNSSSFISLYTEQNDMLDLNKKTIIEDTKIIGIITARPIHIFINNGDTNANFDAYYIDYLCVDKSYRKKGIAPQIIQTHHYNQSHLNKNINVSLFKREDELTGIIPLCVYSTFGFPMDKWRKPIGLPGLYKLLEITETNFHFLYDFIKQNHYQFDIIINTDIGNIIELIKTKNIFVYVLLDNSENENNVNNIKCAYFYRKTCVFYEKDLEILSCFASINNFEKYDKEGEKLFIHGFKISFWETAEKNYFGFAVIENISHNYIIIDNVRIKTKPVVISPTAYFFYNFAYHTFKPDKVLIIN